MGQLRKVEEELSRGRITNNATKITNYVANDN